jgi:uncharacterized membrane protein
MGKRVLNRTNGVSDQKEEVNRAINGQILGTISLIIGICLVVASIILFFPIFF